MADAPTRTDPSGTRAIRNRAWREAQKRWSQVARLAAEAIGKADILGVAPSVASISHSLSTGVALAPLPGSDKVSGFQAWLEEAFRQTVLGGGTTSWIGSLIHASAEMARTRAMGLVAARGSVPPASSPRPSPEFLDGHAVRYAVAEAVAIRQSAAEGDLRALTQTAAQRGARIVANGLLARHKPDQIGRAVAADIRKLAPRLALVIETTALTVFNSATLATFRALGVQEVGTIPERLPPLPMAADAARNTPQMKHPGTGKFVSKRTYRLRHGKTGRFKPFSKPATAAEQRRAESAEKSLEAWAAEAGGEVEVTTADDDRVCQRCQDVADNGPYSLAKAEGLIPLHFRCRCVYSLPGALPMKTTSRSSGDQGASIIQ